MTQCCCVVSLIEVIETTDRTLIRAEEGPKVLHAPPTAHMVQSIPTLAVAVDTLGEYKWRHHGDFSISTLNAPKPLQKLEKLNKFFFSNFDPNLAL